MNIEDFFSKRGWSKSSSVFNATIYQLEVKGSPCLLNDKLLVTVTQHPPIYHYPTYDRLFEVDITGQYRPDNWVHVKVYSLTESEIRENLDSYVTDLTKAWEAMYHARTV